MNRHIPLEKQSKKQQKAWHLKKRGSWEGVKPVTRVAESRTIYSRKRLRALDRNAVHRDD